MSMEITPSQIQERQFHDAFRGYSHEEVDLFLDEVAEAFERTYRENQTFHHRLKSLEEDLKTARATEDMLKRTLITAQKTAEEAVEEARSKAQSTIATADEKAQSTVSAAEEKAKKLIEDAESRAAGIVEDARRKQRELEVTLEGLKRFEQEYRARLEAFIQSQLQVLAEGPKAPSTPRPPSVSDTEFKAPPAPAKAPAPAEVSGKPAAPLSEEKPVAVKTAPPASPSKPSAPAPAEAVPSGRDQSWAVPPPLRREPHDKPEESLVRAGRTERAEDSERSTGPAERGVEEDREEETSIKKLFWGED